MAGSRLLGVLWALALIHEAIALSALSTNFVQAELHHNPRAAAAFVQHSDKFWAYDRVTKSWTETDLSCLFNNGSWWHSCSMGRKTKASSPRTSGQPLQFSSKGDPRTRHEMNSEDGSSSASSSAEAEDSKTSCDSSSTSAPPLELSSLRRISMVRFSDVSLWITGQSGAIYERFWNGVQWVVIPHDLPAFAGRATAVLSVNRTMVAMSESGILYQVRSCVLMDL